MKSKFKIFGIIIATVLLGYMQFTQKEQSDISLFNAEALAYGEIGTIYCMAFGPLDCPISSVKVYMIL